MPLQTSDILIQKASDNTQHEISGYAASEIKNVQKGNVKAQSAWGQYVAAMPSEGNTIDCSYLSKDTLLNADITVSNSKTFTVDTTKYNFLYISATSSNQYTGLQFMQETVIPVSFLTASEQYITFYLGRSSNDSGYYYSRHICSIKLSGTTATIKNEYTNSTYSTSHFNIWGMR